MPLSQPPLFMQAGKYTAAKDRFLIGAGLYPKGGSQAFPRPGVQPFSVTSASDSAEASFRVTTPIGQGREAGDVEVNMGAAYVAGPATGVLNGTYLVINDGVTTVKAGQASPGSQRVVNIYVQVIDAESNGTETSAEAKFVAQVASEQDPMNSLLLASVSLNASNGVGSIEDKRVYTTSHGGTLLVARKADLTEGDMALLPLGSQAYSIADKTVFTRTPNSWESHSVVPVTAATTPPQAALVPNGYQFFHSTDGTLRIYYDGSSAGLAAGWYTIGRATGKVTDTDGSYTNERRERSVTTGSWAVSMPVSAAPATYDYFAVGSGSLTPVQFVSSLSSWKPTDADLVVRFTVNAAKTLVTVPLVFEGYARDVGNPASAPGVPNNFYNACVVPFLEMNKNGTWVADADYNYSSSAFIAWQWTGVRSAGEKDGLRGRTVLYSLGPGEYRVSPRFKLEGPAGANHVLAVASLSIGVGL